MAKVWNQDTNMLISFCYGTSCCLAGTVYRTVLCQAVFRGYSGVTTNLVASIWEGMTGRRIEHPYQCVATYVILISNFRLFWMLYAFFCIIPRHLNFVCRRFGTFCLFHLHRQVVVWRMNEPPACEDGTNRVFRNVGTQNSDAGE